MPVTLPLAEALSGHFFKLTKSGKFKPWECAPLPASVADTHAHLQQLPHPELALARAALHNVGLIGVVADIVEEQMATLDALPTWNLAAQLLIERQREALLAADDGAWGGAAHPAFAARLAASDETVPVSATRIIVGCHPHNAKDFDAAAHEALVEALKDPRTAVIGEVGLDYHYDLSPRAVQRDVFEEQIALSFEYDLPLMLHIRDAHDEALEILNACGWPSAGVVLHCYTLGAHELEPWLEHDANIAFGGALTFGRSEGIREAAAIVPVDRLLTETDAPYMAPHPLRGQLCEPAMVALTVLKLLEVRGADTEDEARALLDVCMGNAQSVINQAPRAYQTRPLPLADEARAQALVEALLKEEQRS